MAGDSAPPAQRRQRELGGPILPTAGQPGSGRRRQHCQQIKDNHQILLLEFPSPPCCNRERPKLKTNEKSPCPASGSCLPPQHPLFKHIFLRKWLRISSLSASMCYATQQLQSSHRTDSQRLQLDLIERVSAPH